MLIEGNKLMTYRLCTSGWQVCKVEEHTRFTICTEPFPITRHRKCVSLTSATTAVHFWQHSEWAKSAGSLGLAATLTKIKSPLCLRSSTCGCIRETATLYDASKTTESAAASGASALHVRGRKPLTVKQGTHGNGLCSKSTDSLVAILVC